MSSFPYGLSNKAKGSAGLSALLRHPKLEPLPTKQPELPVGRQGPYAGGRGRRNQHLIDLAIEAHERRTA